MPGFTEAGHRQKGGPLVNSDNNGNSNSVNIRVIITLTSIVKSNKKNKNNNKYNNSSSNLEGSFWLAPVASAFERLSTLRRPLLPATVEPKMLRAACKAAQLVTALALLIMYYIFISYTTYHTFCITVWGLGPRGPRARIPRTECILDSSGA